MSNNAGYHLLFIATTNFAPNSPTFEKEFAESAYFRKINKILLRRTQSYEQMNEKQLNRLFCNNAGHHLIFIAITHFAPNSPTFEKEFAESAFFWKINRILLSRRLSFERMNEKQWTQLLCNNVGHHLTFIAIIHCSSNSPTFEKKFAESAFFRKINKILPRRTQSYERMNEKH